MNDESGTHEFKLGDLQKPLERDSSEGFSKDEIDSLADLIGEESDLKPKIDLEDTGRFTR